MKWTSKEALDVLTCPSCKESLTRSDGSDLFCPRCGAVGRYENAVYDFLVGVDRLPGAAGARFDLRRDEFAARRISDARTDLAQQRTVESTERSAKRANERFGRRYRRVNDEVGLRHGQAILQKLSNHLPAASPALTVVLEAGGAQGQYLPGFLERFDRAIFLDCSLENIVVAQALTEELAPDRIIFVRANVERLPIRDASIDMVHENGIIEHVLEPQAMVEEGLRVTRPGGTYACVSPNRFSIALEPHFLLPLFGAWPKWARRYLIPRLRGLESEEGTELRSLSQLRTYITAAGARATIYFLAAGLQDTARKTLLRRMVLRILSMPRVGHLIAAIINGPLLGIMPQHIAVVRPLR